jgi:hypothetical protein
MIFTHTRAKDVIKSAACENHKMQRPRDINAIKRGISQITVDKRIDQLLTTTRRGLTPLTKKKLPNNLLCGVSTRCNDFIDRVARDYGMRPEDEMFLVQCMGNIVLREFIFTFGNEELAKSFERSEMFKAREHIDSRLERKIKWDYNKVLDGIVSNARTELPMLKFLSEAKPLQDVAMACQIFLDDMTRTEMLSQEEKEDVFMYFGHLVFMVFLDIFPPN